MRRRRVADVAATLLVVGVGGYVLAEALRLDYAENGVPGAGFAPFWIGLGLALAGTATLVAVLRGAPVRRAADDRDEAARGGLPGSLLVGAITGAWVLLIPYAGLTLSLAAFIVAVPLALGIRRVPVLVALALAVPIAFHLVFERWLGVPLPRGVWF